MAWMIAIIECLCHVAIELAGYEMEGWFVVSGNLLLVVRSKAFTNYINSTDPRHMWSFLELIVAVTPPLRPGVRERGIYYDRTSASMECLRSEKWAEVRTFCVIHPFPACDEMCWSKTHREWTVMFPIEKSLEKLLHSKFGNIHDFHCETYGIPVCYISQFVLSLLCGNK